jgi:predicted RNase H-like HicB family nuclease
VHRSEASGVRRAHPRSPSHLQPPDVAEIINLQPRGKKAKPYQVNQLRAINVASEVLTMTSKYRYEIIIYWSNDDSAFIAEVPELPGCAADGQTYQEALAQTEVVISEWIATATELGRPIPEPRGRLTFA